jgi:hypothetical protein
MSIYYFIALAKPTKEIIMKKISVTSAPFEFKGFNFVAKFVFTMTEDVSHLLPIELDIYDFRVNADDHGVVASCEIFNFDEIDSSAISGGERNLTWDFLLSGDSGEIVTLSIGIEKDSTEENWQDNFSVFAETNGTFCCVTITPAVFIDTKTTIAIGEPVEEDSLEENEEE